MKLTLPQRDIYFEQLVFSDEPIYNIGAKVLIKGALNKNIFEQAYIKLIEQHDAIRSFIVEDFEDTQSFISDKIRPLEFIDFSNEKSGDVKALQFMKKEFKKVFNFKKDHFLYRLALIKVSDNFHYLFSVYHHIIVDGWATSLMFKRLVCNYNEIIENGNISTEYISSYKDFVIENEKYLNSDDFKEDKSYWKNKFKILPEKLFPKINPSIQTISSSRETLVIKRENYNNIIALASETKSTTFHVILAILFAYLNRRYKKEKISIGIPVLNRSGKKSKNTVGLFMSVSPLLLEINENETFINLLENIKKRLRQDYRHQRFPLREMIKELQLFQKQEELFNITLSYEKHDYSNNFINTDTTVVPLSHESERVALAIYIREFDILDDVRIDFDYNINYFTNDNIKFLIKHIEKVMNEILSNRLIPIKHINYLTDEECKKLLIEFNSTKYIYPKDKTIIDLFEEQTKITTNKIAVQDSKIKITYKELKEKSDKVAAFLLSKYGISNEPIGVLMNRSAELIIILLGILKSGRCYIPIDPALPKERIDYIIQHSKSLLVIVDEVSIKHKMLFDKEKHLFIIPAKKILNYKQSFHKQAYYKPTPTDTAYIIYTSGSTGIPKGVEIGHQSLTNFCISMLQAPGIQKHDILYSVTTYSFDISILEFFVPLISGATTFISNKEILNNVKCLIKELEQIKPTIIQSTPSFFQMLFDAGWKGSNLLKVLCGGDSLNENLAEKLISHNKEVWNMYGPTETTIWSSIKKIEKASDASYIGQPINNTQIYILNEEKELLPVGDSGKIYIAGDGLAKGYYKDTKLTEEKFIVNPFTKNTRIYDTGDLGKWLPNGNIKFLGRNDLQMKIRGYRIELGDIESHILQYSDELEQVVVDAKKVNNENVLVAYYTSTKKDLIDKYNLRLYLQNKLPEYMIPSFFVRIDQIPLTPNGKINRKALPHITENDIIRKEYIAPRTALEFMLANIWQEVLGINKVGITDNFFELGGHSLTANKIANAISQKFNTNFSLKYIFQNETIEKLSKVIYQDIKFGNIIPASKKDSYPATFDQKNIWIASQREEYANAYNMYAVFEIEGVIDEKLLRESVLKLIQENEILRTNFVEKQGEIYQVIRNRYNLKLDIIYSQKHLIDNQIKSYVTQIFNLRIDPLIKVAVFKIKGINYLVFLTHHIILDGISLEIILKKLINIYNKKDSKNTEKIQFKDYSEWLNSSIEKQDKINFWEKYLEGIKETKIFNNSSLIKGILHTQTYTIPYEQSLSLGKIAQKKHTTLYTIIVTCLSVVISKMLHQNSICIGVVFSGRNNKLIENSIGMFIKTLPYKLNVKKNSSFSSLVEDSTNILLQLEENMNIPYDVNLSSLTDFVIVCNTSSFLEENILNFNSFSLKRIPLHYTASRFPIVFNIYENNSCIKCEIEYDESIGQNLIDAIWEKVHILIRTIINSPQKVIHSIDLSTQKEIQQKNNLDISFDF